ncbi:hypothetical protein RHSIM_RhsimUnG0240700 [Rhododendron simsii]|uniref:VWFA domain-containing protein n=1 Tax=Rhododendron simsii TaxID=118357 RepID=A0A834L3S4_RHOSS|nr:hypothetical protein RHSIM_RhsimUnG0240700 [Rhododendron simsii]
MVLEVTSSIHLFPPPRFLIDPFSLPCFLVQATMICVDNSEWMRNGDYSPTRFQAQADAVNLICGAKTQSNPENTVGVLTMAGKGVRVLVTPTSDLGKILACMHGQLLHLAMLCRLIRIVSYKNDNLSAAMGQVHLFVPLHDHKQFNGTRVFFLSTHVRQIQRTVKLRLVLFLSATISFCLSSGLEVGGECNLAAGIQVAQLALKHRQNKKQQQRIIVFVGSPVKYDKKVLEMIGRKLKKNSVALDIVNFGEEDEGKAEKLEALLAAVNNNDSSHIVHVPSDSSALSDVLISTPIFTGDGEGGSSFAAAAAAAAAGGVSGYDFGVDPNLDPELALALRVSMEEERARQEAAAKKAAEEASKQEKGGEQPSASQDATMTENVTVAAPGAEDKTSDLMVALLVYSRQLAALVLMLCSLNCSQDDENALLQQALAMSMDDPVASVVTRDTDMSEAAAEDEDLALGNH